MKRKNNPWVERFELSFDYPGVGAPATGLITCVTNANMADTDYITIGDGVSAAKLYEYDKAADGVTGGRVSWAAGASTAADVAATLKTAINANQPSIDVTDNLDGTLTLRHKVPGTAGNVTITENVANAGFLVSGMTGGVDPHQIAATLTRKLFTAKRKMRVESAELISREAVAGHASNHWTLAVKKGATTMASYTSDSDVAGQGTIAADTAKAFALSGTDADVVTAVDDVISLVMTKAASAPNLPAGRLTVRGHYVS